MGSFWPLNCLFYTYPIHPWAVLQEPLISLSEGKSTAIRSIHKTWLPVLADCVWSCLECSGYLVIGRLPEETLMVVNLFFVGNHTKGKSAAGSDRSLAAHFRRFREHSRLDGVSKGISGEIFDAGGFFPRNIPHPKGFAIHHVTSGWIIFEGKSLFYWRLWELQSERVHWFDCWCHSFSSNRSKRFSFLNFGVYAL